MTELPIPRAVQSDKSAIELARIWIAGGKQHISLATNVWNDPAAWGLMLVDVARHVAAAYQQTAGLDPNETLNRMKDAFDAEWSYATDQPEGGLMQ